MSFFGAIVAITAILCATVVIVYVLEYAKRLRPTSLRAIEEKRRILERRLQQSTIRDGAHS